MRHLLARAMGLGVVALCVTGATTGRGSQPSQDAEAVVEYGALLDEQASILAKLDALDDAIDEARRRVEATDDAQARVLVRFVQATVDLADAAQALQRRRAQLGKRLRALVTAERTRRLALWLDVAAVARNDRRLRLLGELARADRARVRQYVAALEALRRARAQLDEQRQQLLAAEEANRRSEARLAALAAERDELLERVRTERAAFEAAHRELAAVYADLTDRIRRLETWRAGPVPFERLRGRLRLPMSYARIVTSYGVHRNAVLGTQTFSPGVEIASDGSNSVRVVHWGRVAFVGDVPGLGTTVIVDHGGGYHTVYAHLASVLVEVGDVVESRQVLGTVGGHSGIGTPGTLYFELRAAGRPVDPRAWFGHP